MTGSHSAVGGYILQHNHSPHLPTHELNCCHLGDNWHLPDAYSAASKLTLQLFGATRYMTWAQRCASTSAGVIVIPQALLTAHCIKGVTGATTPPLYFKCTVMTKAVGLFVTHDSPVSQALNRPVWAEAARSQSLPAQHHWIPLAQLHP